MFPHKTNKKTTQYTFDFAIEHLKRIGEKAREYGHRLTFHPGQYNVVGTPHSHCYSSTVDDLSYQADVLDFMGMGKDSVMVVHGGGLYGNKKETIKRWIKQFKLLPDKVKRRLVLENCERAFSIKDCLYISKKVNIPVVFDTHHFNIYKTLHPEDELKEASYYMPYIIETWVKRGIKPKFHISEQGNGRIGKHSNFVEVVPEYLLEIPELYHIDIDIMIKAKEAAIFKLYKKYPFLNCSTNK